jgi:glycosyltransferase involved in cell wall biosynthesis
MLVYVPNLNKGGMGGGPTFVENFRKHTTLELTQTHGHWEAMFVPNPMWAERADFELAKQMGIPIILRLDNIPEDWNNRGSAISKLKDYIAWSNVIIYQSRWSAEKYREFIVANNIKSPPLFYIIHNGADTELFTPSGDNIVDNTHPKILYVKSGRNENKRYPEAMEMFRRVYAHNNRAKLYLVGQFADDYHKYNFGFYNGENYQYLGIQPHEQMPMIYRSADILFFPAYADAAPNTVLEAMSCGVVPIIHPYGGGVEFIGGSIDENEHSYGVEINDNYDYILQALSRDRESIREHIVKNFDIRDCVKKYEQVIREQA